MKRKGRRVGALVVVRVEPCGQAMPLIACERRDFVRDARFLWTIFLSAMRSITACDAFNFCVAAALSPLWIALRTCFTAVRSDDLKLALCLLLFPSFRARFLSSAPFALDGKSFTIL